MVRGKNALRSVLLVSALVVCRPGSPRAEEPGLQPAPRPRAPSRQAGPSSSQTASPIRPVAQSQEPRARGRRSERSAAARSQQSSPKAQVSKDGVPAPPIHLPLGGLVFPRPGYYLAMNAFYQGNFGQALQLFRQEAQAAMRSAEGQTWVDSIYYHTMIGQCLEQLGQLPDALESYNTAARLYLSNPDWALTILSWPSLQAAPRAAVIAAPWGQSRRGSAPAVYSQNHLAVAIHQLPFGLRRDLLHLSGANVDEIFVDNEQGALRAALEGRIVTLDVPELLRCLAVMSVGRHRILGPVARHDPLSRQLFNAFQQRRFTRGHWSESWGELLLGLAYVGQGQIDQAGASLERSLLLRGQFDHHLTATGLLQLAHLEAAAGGWVQAQHLYEEASYAAYFYGDPLTVGEALQGAALAHRLAGGVGPLPALVGALQWVRSARWQPPAMLPSTLAGELLPYHPLTLLSDTHLYQLHTSLVLTDAEQALWAREPKAAIAALSQARTLISRQKMDAAPQRARFEHLWAQAGYQQGRRDQGDAALGRALEIQAPISPRRFQIQYAHRLALNNAGGSLQLVQELYPLVLREIAPDDWLRDPLEAMASVSWPDEEPLHHWFLTLWSRGRTKEAWEVAEQIRRDRFLSSLPLAGRMLALRWILEAPEGALSRNALLERSSLHLRYPAYAQWTRAWSGAYAELHKLPLSPVDPDERRRQEQLLKTLGELDQARDLLLREIACSREPLSMPFPPRLALAELQQRLKPGQLLWSFLATSPRVYSFLVSRDSFAAWEVGATEDVAGRVQTLLRALGNVHGHRAVPVSVLEDEHWKTLSRELLAVLLGAQPPRRLAEADEVVVVPDGCLWYLPFEVLGAQHADGNRTITSLLVQTRWRYAPTAPLGVAGESLMQRSADPEGGTLVILDRGKPDDAERWDARLQGELKEAGQRLAAVQGRAPSRLAVPPWMVGRLLALAETSWPPEGPSAWSPLPTAGNQRAATLADFVEHPWQGLSEVVIAGLHTPADSAFDKADPQAAGHAMFLTATAWMASGARTVLISRWNVGGESSGRLVREFLQELPHTSASDAWQRAVLLSSEQPLDPEAEPRLQRSASKGKPPEPLPLAAHPFFWAGPLLIDAGP